MPETGTRYSTPPRQSCSRQRPSVQPAESDLSRRRAHLLRLHHELGRLGARARVQKPRNGRWRLKLRQARWTETVLCAGAEDTFAYVTGNGRVLGPTQDVRYVAQVLVWMIEGKHR